MEIDEGESPSAFWLVRQRPQLVYEVPQFVVGQVAEYVSPGLTRESMAAAFLAAAGLLGVVSVSQQAGSTPVSGGDLVVKRLRTQNFPRLGDGKSATSGPTSVAVTTVAPVNVTPAAAQKRSKGISPQVRHTAAPVALRGRYSFRVRNVRAYRRRKYRRSRRYF